MTKEEARRYIQNIRKEMPPSQVETRSRIVTGRLFGVDLYQHTPNILAYASCNREVDTYELMRRSIGWGKNVYVPKVYGREMRFYRIPDPEVLKPGSFGIPEPPGSLPEWKGGNALMVMPGLAFDYDRNRVGYGGGFYDRFLSAHPGLDTVALCFDFQLVDRIEAEPHDLKPDAVICEKGILKKTGTE